MNVAKLSGLRTGRL